MWHQRFNCNFTKLREYFLCTKKTKITILFNNYFPPWVCVTLAPFWRVSRRMYVLSSERKQGTALACSASAAPRTCRSKYVHMSWYSQKWCQGDIEELLNKVVILFRKRALSRALWSCIETTFKSLATIEVHYGQKIWNVFLKKLNFFATEEGKTWTSWRTWGWVIMRTFLFWKWGWTIPLR